MQEDCRHEEQLGGTGHNTPAIVNRVSVLPNTMRVRGLPPILQASQDV